MSFHKFSLPKNALSAIGRVVTLSYHHSPSPLPWQMNHADNAGDQEQQTNQEQEQGWRTRDKW